MLTEIIIVFVLTLFNGFFSMSEIALVTVRHTKISQLIKAGKKGAVYVELLKKKPENFFATIQIGISVITIAASAFAGASIADDFAEILKRFDYNLISDNAYMISFTFVVAFVSY